MKIYYKSNVIKIKNNIIYPNTWVDLGDIKGYIKTIYTYGEAPHPNDRVIIDNSTPHNGSKIEISMENFTKLYRESQGYDSSINYTPLKLSFVVSDSHEIFKVGDIVDLVDLAVRYDNGTYKTNVLAGKIIEIGKSQNMYKRGYIMVDVSTNGSKNIIKATANKYDIAKPKEEKHGFLSMLKNLFK